MKNSTPNNDFNNISYKLERNTLENTEKKNNSCKAVKTMYEPLITPPPRVWDKIQAILDEQDNRRKSANTIIESSFGVKVDDGKRKRIYLATIAGLSLAAGFVLLVR